MGQYKGEGMNFLKKITIVFFILSVVSACTGKDGEFDLTKPYSLDLTPPEGPPIYEQGWSEGCESGLASYSGNFYKFIRVYDYKQDARLRTNKMYYQAWQDAYVYCAIYIMNVTNEGI